VDFVVQASGLHSSKDKERGLQAGSLHHKRVLGLL